MNDLRHRRKKQNFRIDSSIAHLSKQINIEEEEKKKLSYIKDKYSFLFKLKKCMLITSSDLYKKTVFKVNINIIFFLNFNIDLFIFRIEEEEKKRSRFVNKQNLTFLPIWTNLE